MSAGFGALAVGAVLLLPSLWWLRITQPVTVACRGEVQIRRPPAKGPRRIDRSGLLLRPDSRKTCTFPSYEEPR